MNEITKIIKDYWYIMTEDNPPKFETIADLPDDDLKKLISKYLDYLCDMGISIERINSEGKEYSDNLLKTKNLFDNNKLTSIWFC